MWPGGWNIPSDRTLSGPRNLLLATSSTIAGGSADHGGLLAHCHHCLGRSIEPHVVSRATWRAATLVTTRQTSNSMSRPSLSITSHPTQCHIGHHCISQQLAPHSRATQCATRRTAVANAVGPAPPLNNRSPRCSTLHVVDTATLGLQVLVIIETSRFVGSCARHPSTGGHPAVSVVCTVDSVLPTEWVLRTLQTTCRVRI